MPALNVAAVHLQPMEICCHITKQIHGQALPLKDMLADNGVAQLPLI